MNQVAKINLRQVIAGVALMSSLMAPSAYGATPKQLAVRLFDRLVGYVSPTDPRLAQVETLIAGSDFKAAAAIVTKDRKFGDEFLFRYFSKMCNRNKDATSSLNDCILTGIGITWKEDAANRQVGERDYNYKDVVTADLLFESSLAGLTARNAGNNTHYENLFGQRFAQSFVQNLRMVSPQRTGNPDFAGVLTSNQFLREHVEAGTNRRWVQYALEEFVLYPAGIDAMRTRDIDTSRVRQDVSRAPGNNPTAFEFECRTCHSFLDPMTSAVNLWDNVNGVPTRGTALATKIRDRENNANPGQTGYLPGYKDSLNTPVDSFVIRADSGTNRWIGWEQTSGQGLNGIGQAIANSFGFRLAAVNRAWELACMRAPLPAEYDRVEKLAEDFKDVMDFKLTRLIEEIATSPECLGR